MAKINAMQKKVEVHMSMYRSSGFSYSLCSTKSRFWEKLFH
jgi:hypothetical protein